MKVVTILGTRPEIIRLSRVIAKLDHACSHVLLHTGQNYDPNLKDVFFRELRVRAPDRTLDSRGTFAEQIGLILSSTERLLREESPDRLLILGDTNSSLAAFVAKRMAIPVFHMEAGNRCYDDRVPEEVNRRVIDHCSDVLMPYTERSRQNLLREGFAGKKIYVTGNPINEVIRHYDQEISSSTILTQLDLQPSRYFLVTMHRAENVDNPGRLASLLLAFQRLNEEHGLPVIVSTHPRTRDRMIAAGYLRDEAGVRFLSPFGFFDFIHLERHAACVLSDSGTVQEECAIFQVPLVTIRDVTERPETVENGCNVLSGADVEQVLACTRSVLARTARGRTPAEYLVDNVSDTVTNLMLGYHHS